MSFADAVAERARHALSAVETVLADYGIEPQPTVAAPVSLIVTRVKFSGVKSREGHDDEPFEFERDLGPGLWAVASESSNLAGKTSVLLVIRWALTGRSHLTDDVFSWIEAVELDGQVGSTAFAIQFTKGPDGVAGALRSGDAILGEFDSTNFEEVVDGFFLDRLRLDATPFWQGRAGGQDDEGDRRRFGWASYFPALHLRPENLGQVLGDQMMGGQPGALMQVFLGLPWARTAASARVARNELRMRRSAKSRRRAEDAAARESALAPLRKELLEAREALNKLRTERPPISPAEADQRLAHYAEALASQRDAETQAARARTALELAQADVDDATKRQKALEQSQLIRPLLGRLTPTVCPRCETGITVARIAGEETTHQCSVCTEPLATLELDEEELDAARTAATLAQTEFATAELERADAERVRVAAALAKTAAEQAVRELEERRPAETQVRELETQIARLEGRLDQPVVPETPEDAGIDAAYEIVEAARREAEDLRSTAAQDLLQQLGQQIAELGRQFGIDNLETASPTLAAQLRVRIGGADSPFSARTGGERLRLRLATVIALLRVGHRRGAGRHPGLLLIDSPGGEEMVEGDVTAILRELGAICEEMPDLQLICATARAAEVREAIAADHIIHGTDFGEVW